jgi:hypothetical protein
MIYGGDWMRTYDQHVAVILAAGKSVLVYVRVCKGVCVCVCPFFLLVVCLLYGACVCKCLEGCVCPFFVGSVLVFWFWLFIQTAATTSVLKGVSNAR